MKTITPSAIAATILFAAFSAIPSQAKPAADPRNPEKPQIDPAPDNNANAGNSQPHRNPCGKPVPHRGMVLDLRPDRRAASDETHGSSLYPRGFHHSSE